LDCILLVVKSRIIAQKIRFTSIEEKCTFNTYVMISKCILFSYHIE
jgi:hypothetical protein